MNNTVPDASNSFKIKELLRMVPIERQFSNYERNSITPLFQINEILDGFLHEEDVDNTENIKFL